MRKYISAVVGDFLRLRDFIQSDAASSAILKVAKVEFYYGAPVLTVFFVSDDFEGLSFGERLGVFKNFLSKIDCGFSYEDEDREFFSLELLTLSEFESHSRSLSGSGKSWVQGFFDAELMKVDANLSLHQNNENDFGGKFVHFYGYKGGQGRSTVLTLLSQLMADDGYNILVVDADFEAPSLDYLFRKSTEDISETLMGACGWVPSIRSLKGAYLGQRGGMVDILPCRPRDPAADLDFALLLANAPISDLIYQEAASKILELSESYDYVFIDHRTGISSSVIPMVAALPGVVTIFGRSDANVSQCPSDFVKVVRTLFSLAPDPIGAFVSFSLLPVKAGQELNRYDSPYIRSLREELDSAWAHRSPEGLDYEPDEDRLDLHCIDWFFDGGLAGDRLPIFDGLLAANKASLSKIRSVLGLLEGQKFDISRLADAEVIDVRSGDSDVSGSKDAGPFIKMPSVHSIFVEGNSTSYIVGRKGTGKSRIVSELAKAGLGDPFVVAEDFYRDDALKANSMLLNEVLKRFEAPDDFWIALFRIYVESKISGLGFNNRIESFVRNSDFDIRQISSPMGLKDAIAVLPEKAILLVDGLETFVSSERIQDYIEALFQVVAGFQNDALVSKKLEVKIFIRQDLVKGARQNIEQQIGNRGCVLNWDMKEVLNFVLSRMVSLNFVKNNFTEFCNKVRAMGDMLKMGAVSEKDALDCLLMVFPSRIRGRNLTTGSFLKLYFSDAGGGVDGTFYPRLYLSFLMELDKKLCVAVEPISHDRIDSSFILSAYDLASNDFVDSTKQELRFLLSLEDESGVAKNDMDSINAFFEAFRGCRTPFIKDELANELSRKTGFSVESLNKALIRMKDMRVFEEVKTSKGSWRVGQLYKESLGMKFTRGPQSNTNLDDDIL